MHGSTAIAVSACLLALQFAPATPAQVTPRQSERPKASPFDDLARAPAPVVLCIDDKPSVGGQPSGEAYAKAAANGFRSVLTFRSPKDGIDTLRERLMVENARMRYFNIAAGDGLPTHAQVAEFLKISRDNANHPMLVNCGFAERVAPFMAVFRVKAQGWSEDRAVEEGLVTGTQREHLRKFLSRYLGKNTPPMSPKG
jgi:protein tyrosine phosphatase (PTP) superfamily phosphohydrolase (DUF442 family)